MGAYSREGGGGSLTICGSRVRVYSREGLFREEGGNSRIYVIVNLFTASRSCRLTGLASYDSKIL